MPMAGGCAESLRHSMFGRSMAWTASCCRSITPASLSLGYGYRTGQLLITASSGDDKRIDRFVTNFYFAALGREPSATELSQQHAAFIQAAQQGQSQLLAAAQTLGQQLFDLGNQSNEYNQRNRSDEEFVTDLYFAYLQRSPDEVGLG
jgi:hypothetical protein